MKAFIHKLSEILDKISSVICATILAGLCLIIVYSVIMRFIFNNPVTWQYELTLVGLCWAIFIGMPMTFHKQEHLRLTFQFPETVVNGQILNCESVATLGQNDTATSADTDYAAWRRPGAGTGTYTVDITLIIGITDNGIGPVFSFQGQGILVPHKDGFIIYASCIFDI